MTRGPALLLAGHGSVSQAGIAEYFALADGGHRDVVVVPLVLVGAGHAKADIPAVVAQARRDFPEARLSYARELGVHPDLLAVVSERLDATVPVGLRAETAVLLVGRGSSDPDANADVLKVARLLWEGRDWPTVEACFVGITGPRVPEGLERCRRLGHRRIAVAPYFLFTGVLERRIHAQAGAFAATRPEVAVQVTRYLGPDDRIAELVLQRYREAFAGPVPRSCDTCVHRLAQASAQPPHHHG